MVLPGVSDKDLKVTLHGNQLHIAGERQEPKDFSKEGYWQRQLSYGKFERAFDLPAGLDLGKVKAHLHDGVLDVTIPVAEEKKPREITIDVTKSGKALAA